MKVNTLKYITFVQIIFVLFNINIIAQTSSSSTNYFSIRNRLKFGNYLFTTKDYLRAIDEYKTVLKKLNSDTLLFKIGYSYEQMKYLSDADFYFQKLSGSKNLSRIAEFEILKTNFLEGNYDKVKQLFESQDSSENEYYPNAAKLFYSTYMLGNNKLPDSSNYKLWFNAAGQTEIMNFYKRKINPGYKSPTLAAVLSTVVPGLGKIYAGETSDGITAFLFNGILGFLAYDNFRAHHKLRAWIFTGLTALFYGGNIYGSISAAQIYNAGIRFNFGKDFKIFLNKHNYFSPKYYFIYK